MLQSTQNPDAFACNVFVQYKLCSIFHSLSTQLLIVLCTIVLRTLLGFTFMQLNFISFSLVY